MEATESKRILADNVCLARKVLRTIAVCPVLQYCQEAPISARCLRRFESKDDRCDNTCHAEPLLAATYNS